MYETFSCAESCRLAAVFSKKGKNTGPRLLLIHASHCFLQNDVTSKVLDKTTTTGGPGSESPLKRLLKMILDGKLKAEVGTFQASKMNQLL